MAAIRITDTLARQRDVNLVAPIDLQVLSFDAATGKWINASPISGSGTISDAAYDGAGWDGVTTAAPSKNAVRDKVETLASIGLAAGLAIALG